MAPQSHGIFRLHGMCDTVIAYCDGMYGISHVSVHNHLQFHGASILQQTWDLCFILIFEYHSRGSLRRVLQSSIISWRIMCIMSKSIAEALAYLHGEQGIKIREITESDVRVECAPHCIKLSILKLINNSWGNDKGNPYLISTLKLEEEAHAQIKNSPGDIAAY